MITPDEALSARNFHGRIPIDRMAALLLPRGVSAEQVAGLAISGMWTGEQSARYQSLGDQFTAYTNSDDPNIAAVGRAGVEIFVHARDEALIRERQRRIRGEM